MTIFFPGNYKNFGNASLLVNLYWQEFAFSSVVLLLIGLCFFFTSTKEMHKCGWRSKLPSLLSLFNSTHDSKPDSPLVTLLVQGIPHFEGKLFWGFLPWADSRFCEPYKPLFKIFYVKWWCSLGSFNKFFMRQTTVFIILSYNVSEERRRVCGLQRSQGL